MMASSATANDSEASRARKTPTTTTLRPPEQDLKCPRCDSPNTKFCYYNNYSLTQPRHFCKTCRRYWTKGGALRNVPVGGGCRRNKKGKSSSSSSSLLSSSSSSRLHLDPFNPEPSSGSGLKFFTGLSPPPAIDFQLGVLPFSRLQSPATSGVLNSNQLISFGEFTPANSMVGFNYPLTSSVGVYCEMGSSSASVNNNTHNSLASSIESLSSINQDLHLKLQQQRMAMFFGDGTQKESSVPAVPESLVLDEQQEPISFHGGENSRADSIAWFLESSCSIPNTNANNTDNNGGSRDNTSSNWNGIATWNDMHPFTALP